MLLTSMCLKHFEEYTVEFPFVVKTKTPVKEVWKFNLKLPVKRINYGTKFTILTGTTTFYYADKFKLPANALRRVVYEFLRLFGQVVVSANVYEIYYNEIYNADCSLTYWTRFEDGKWQSCNVWIYTNLCGLTSWDRFENGEWQSCDTWT
jgi:hypothetical protein